MMTVVASEESEGFEGMLNKEFKVFGSLGSLSIRNNTETLVKESRVADYYLFERAKGVLE